MYGVPKEAEGVGGLLVYEDWEESGQRKLKENLHEKLCACLETHWRLQAMGHYTNNRDGPRQNARQQAQIAATFIATVLFLLYCEFYIVRIHCYPDIFLTILSLYYHLLRTRFYVRIM